MGLEIDDFDRPVDVSALTRPPTEDEEIQGAIEAAQIGGRGFNDASLIDFVAGRIVGAGSFAEKMKFYHDVTGMVDIAAQRGLDHGDGDNLPTRDQAWDTFTTALRVKLTMSDPDFASRIRSSL